MYSRPSTSESIRAPAAPVAPLRIVKTPQLQNYPRQHDTQQGQHTPPPSPPSPRSPRTSQLEYHAHNGLVDSGSPTASIPPMTIPPPPPTYLRALHAFRPTATTMSESDCLSFEPDQIIQVHTLHPSGWADGTLLATNERGWFPSNYCEQYTLSNLRPLLGASSLLYATVRAKRVSHYYTVISCVVTSVRGLLVSCNALSRDTELVKSEPEVRKARKHLLSELGVLASLAKKANAMSTVDLTEETELEIEALGEAIQTRTERLVNRANRLLEIATPLTELWKEEDVYIPPSPPISGGGVQFEFGGEQQHALQWEFASVKGRQTSIATTGAESLGSVSSSLSDDSAAPQMGGSPGSALHRLNLTHDTLLSHLAAYIGRLHLQSRSPAQIFETTNQCVIATRNFLGVIRSVTSRKGNRLSSTLSLEQSSTLLWNKCTTLVNVAREVVSAHGVVDIQGGEGGEDDVVMDIEVKKLVEAATACVRAAGECVALGHCLLEAMGDFDLPVTHPRLNRDSLLSLGSAEDYPTASRSRQKNHLSKQLPPPPLLSDDNPKRPLPVPPQTSSTRKAPPKLKLIPSQTFRTGHSPLTPARSAQPSTSPLRFSSDLSPAAALKARDAEAQSKFLASLREQGPASETASQHDPLDDLQTIPQTPQAPGEPGAGPHERQISHPQLRRESLFRSESDEALRLADTLTMPRSSSSSNVSKEDETSMKSIPTTPEPGTPVRAKFDWNGASKMVVLGNEGQVMGATLEGLVERMTLHDAPPDAILSTTFYLTFRLFTTSRKLAETLVTRFNLEPPSSDKVSQWQKDVATPIKLRVFNVFKGWLESHWRQETDSDALDIIVAFAQGPLTKTSTQSGKRLEDLAQKVSKAAGPLVPKQVSGMGKANADAPSFVMADTPMPPPVISKSLLTQLRAAVNGGQGPSVTDIDPLELARQFTIKESKIYCAVLPEELVGLEFQSHKPNSSAANVRALITLSSVMTAWVADSIMDEADVKRRAAIIKHWIKVCSKCMSLNNYSSLYNIFCALESASIQRLNKTWPLLSSKCKETMDNLRHLTDVGRNHAVYRAELRQRVPPCLPFMGRYLSDLTFVDEGNPATRPVHDAPEGAPPLINFDKHIKTARIISDVQRFQIPYRLQEVAELQTWIEGQLNRVKRAGSLDSMKLYRRSLAIEPRESQQDNRRGSADDNASPLWSSMSRERSSGGTSAKLGTVQEEKVKT